MMVFCTFSSWIILVKEKREQEYKSNLSFYVYAMSLDVHVHESFNGIFNYQQFSERQSHTYTKQDIYVACYLIFRNDKKTIYWDVRECVTDKDNIVKMSQMCSCLENNFLCWFPQMKEWCESLAHFENFIGIAPSQFKR